MYSETLNRGKLAFSPIAGVGQRRLAEASGRLVEQTGSCGSFFGPQALFPDPLRVVLADIASQRFIANADDVTRRILILTIATAVIIP